MHFVKSHKESMMPIMVVHVTELLEKVKLLLVNMHNGYISCR